MEKEIYNIIIEIIYEQTIKKLYDEKVEFIEYPIKIDKITFDVIDIFNATYFKKYKECLLSNAAIYAIKKNDLNYINLFNKKNIEKLVEKDRIVRALITQKAFYNIYKKIKYNNNDDDKIIENNLDLYNKLTKLFAIEIITKKIRKILLNYLNNYDPDDLDIILDLLLTSGYLDNTFIKYDSIFNKNNINYYKNLMFRIILSDNYIYLKSMKKNDDYVLGNDFIEKDEDEYFKSFDTEIINLLENCNLNMFKDTDIRLTLYRNFIIYNILVKKHKQDLENIIDDYKVIKTLKKINPFYFLDLF